MIRTQNFMRVVTAVFLAGVTIAAIFLLEPFLFSIMVGLISAAGAWEWSRLGRETVTLRWTIPFIFLVGAGVPTMLILPAALPWVVGVALLWWIGITCLIILEGWRSQRSGWQAKNWHILLIIFPAAVSITELHAAGSEGRWYVLACLLIVWTTDTSAYMVGRAYGKTLLAPRISPAKTVEGVGGGLVGASIVGLILYEILPIDMICTRFYWVVLTLVTASFSVIGDLTESIYKRAAGVKDSGWILPGHGGILDRVDSTFASSPVFVAGMLFAAR